MRKPLCGIPLPPPHTPPLSTVLKSCAQVVINLRRGKERERGGCLAGGRANLIILRDLRIILNNGRFVRIGRY